MGMNDAPALSPAMTRHAVRRASQRAVPAAVLGWLLDLGERIPAGAGAELVHFPRQARAGLRDEIGAPSYVDMERKLMRAYAIVAADGAVVTVGYRHRRLPRH